MFQTYRISTLAPSSALRRSPIILRARLKDVVYEPSPTNRAAYDVLYREYVRLHDYFGRGENDVMKVLRGLRAQAKAAGTAADPAAVPA